MTARIHFFPALFSNHTCHGFSGGTGTNKSNYLGVLSPGSMAQAEWAAEGMRV